MKEESKCKVKLYSETYFKGKYLGTFESHAATREFNLEDIDAPGQSGGLFSRLIRRRRVADLVQSSAVSGSCKSVEYVGEMVGARVGVLVVQMINVA